jgi:hypothetical protein
MLTHGWCGKHLMVIQKAIHPKCNGFIGAIGFDVLQYMLMHFATKFF